jgi:hypothetical protein
MMIKRILLAVPILTAIGFIINSWVEIATTESPASWQHYGAIILLVIVIYFFFTDFKKAAIFTGIYFLLGAFGAFSLTLDINKSWVRIGSIETPTFNLLSLGLFILFFVLNFMTLTDFYLDYKELKAKKNNN